MTRSLAAAVLALFVTLTQPGPASAEPEAATPVRPDSAETTGPASGGGAIPEEIPVGNAEDDPVTSRAIMQILKECAERYATIKSFRATGTYIEAAKVEQSDKAREEQSAARLEVLYRRPDKLKITVDGDEVAAGLVADGTTVTLLWPKQKEYRRIAQPESLAAFAEEERAGEILEDETNAIVYSVVGALLISEDPLRWLHANVESYVYDGVEEVGGRPAWRIKFLQSDPAIVVINWVDKETKLLSKVSIIQARDEEGDFIESYAQSAYGRIRVAVLNRFETEDDAVEDREFSAVIPRGWTVRKDEVVSRPTRGEQVSAWDRLVRAAAAKKGEETSPSLTAQTGSGLLRLRQAIERPMKLTGLAYAGEVLEQERTIAVASEENVVFLRHDGELVKEIPVRGGADLLTVVGTEESTAPVLVTATTYGDTARGYDLDGKDLWTYQRPGGRISSLLAATPPGAGGPTVYVGYLGGTGLRLLAPDGRLKFASRRLTGITALAAGEVPGTGWRVVASTGSSGGYFAPGGEFLSKMPEEEDTQVQVGLLAIEDSQPSAPLLQVAAVGEAEYVLRRVRPDNSPVWTAPLAQGVKEAEPVGLVVARLRFPEGAGETTATGELKAQAGGVRPCAVTLLSDGRMTVTTPEGAVLWRGKAVFGGTAVSGDVEHTASALLAADLNGDGEDELYVAGEGAILQIAAGGE